MHIIWGARNVARVAGPAGEPRRSTQNMTPIIEGLALQYTSIELAVRIVVRIVVCIIVCIVVLIDNYIVVRRDIL